MTLILHVIVLRFRWLGCLLLILAMVPAGAVGADAATLVASPNPVTIGSTTTISWDSGDLNITPELWISVDNAPQTLFLPLPQPRGNVPYNNVQPGHMYAFFLYTPKKGRLLVPGVTVTGFRSGGFTVSPLPTPDPCAHLCTASMPPSNVYTTKRGNVEDSDGLLCFGPGLGLTGTGPETDPAVPWDTITVGYTHYYSDNDPVFSCSTGDDAFFRGAVRFDLHDFKNDRFIGAKLTFRIKSSRRHYDVGGLNIDAPGIWSAAGGMDRATDDWLDWHPGEYHDYLNGDGAQLPVPSEQVNDPKITLDVSSMVRDWLDGAQPNNGFVFYGKDEGYPRNNDTLISEYTDFTLTLTYG